MTVLCLCHYCAAAPACTRRLMPALCGQTCPDGGRDCAVYSCPDYAEKQSAPVEAHGSALPATSIQPGRGHISDAPIIAQSGAGGKSDADG